MTTLIVLLSFGALGALGALGVLATTPDPENIQDFITAAFSAFNAGNYRYVAAMAIILAVFLLRKFGGKLLPFLTQGRWAWATAVLLGALTTLSAGLLSESPPKTFVAILASLAAGAFTGAGAAGMVKGSSEWFGKTEPPA